TVAGNSTTTIGGTINNTGMIQISAAANNANLLTNGGAVSLMGGGTVILSTTGAGGTALIGQGVFASTAPLTNVNNTLQGTGQIGNGSLVVVNSGTILANAANALVLNPAGAFTNSGTMQANSGSTLNVSTATTNTG